MGIEIIQRERFYIKDETPEIKRIGKKRDTACRIEWAIEIITKNKRIKIFYQK